MEDLLLKYEMSAAAPHMYKVINSFHRPGPGVPAVLYAPETASPFAEIAVLVMHSDADYLSFSAGEELAGRGFKVLCANVSRSGGDLDQKIREVGLCVNYLKGLSGIEKVVLLGHSGGGTLMTAYQSIAEQGPDFFRGERMLKQCPKELAGLPPADGVLLLDSNWGNGAMRLFSLDPAVADERNCCNIDPNLNLFAAENGFAPGGSCYSDCFVRAFFRAQHERNTRLNDYVLGRIAALDAGNGSFCDDEPLVVPGAEQGFFNNKLYAQDLRFQSRTRLPRTLLHADGGETTEIVHTLRRASNDVSFTASLREGALITTVRNYLSSFALRTTPDYSFDECGVKGIDWNSNYNCTTGNVRGVTVPLLIMGMTGGWEFASAETAWENAGSRDRTLAYVEGADHFFCPCRDFEQYPNQFGDTLSLTYDYVCRWIITRFL